MDMAKACDQDLCPSNVSPDREWKFTYNDWILIGQLTETLNIWAAYALIFYNVFLSTDFMYICWATLTTTLMQVLLSTDLLNCKLQRGLRGAQVYNETGFYNIPPDRCLIIGEVSMMSITASYSASVLADLLGLVLPNSLRPYLAVALYITVLAGPTLSDLSSNQPLARMRIVKEMLNALQYILLAFAIATATDDRGTSTIFSAWMRKKSLITLTMYAWLYTLYGLEGVFYLAADMKDHPVGTPGTMIWSMILAGPVACIWVVMLRLTGKTKSLSYSQPNAHLMHWLSHPLGLVWDANQISYAFVRMVRNAFIVVNIYTAGTVMLWSIASS